ncbi:fucose mutarotase-like [Bacillus rossius redtenbacheri]|uniref:fucose mutarotase-like n=1 Tax=Bacillus rossius redtenbacheri TaxID=93214 RepID=UPI002FDE3EB1
MGRLKGIPDILSPDLLHVLASMGHGDEIVLADANYPSASTARARGARELRADFHSVSALLDAILQFFPLDTYVDKPVAVMRPTASDRQKGVTVDIWDRYKDVMRSRTGRSWGFDELERFDFYERAKGAYAVVQTGETALYSNVILKKGAIAD